MFKSQNLVHFTTIQPSTHLDGIVKISVHFSNADYSRVFGQASSHMSASEQIFCQGFTNMLQRHFLSSLSLQPSLPPPFSLPPLLSLPPSLFLRVSVSGSLCWVCKWVWGAKDVARQTCHIHSTPPMNACFRHRYRSTSRTYVLIWHRQYEDACKRRYEHACLRARGALALSLSLSIRARLHTVARSGGEVH